jgi:hypothetical protein
MLDFHITSLHSTSSSTFLYLPTPACPFAYDKAQAPIGRVNPSSTEPICDYDRLLRLSLPTAARDNDEIEWLRRVRDPYKMCCAFGALDGL